MNGIAYFDNAATTFPKPEEVYIFMDKFYRECGVNVGRGQHKLAAKATALVTETRELLLSLNHCPSKRVVFMNTATEALNTILRGIRLSDGSNVYVSPFEHNAVMRTLYYIAQTKQINVIPLAFDKEDSIYDLEEIGYQFTEHRPSLVIISHASNICGIIIPIMEIIVMSKQHGAINVIDMCQTMGLVETSLNTSDIDYAVFAGHKTLYAPFGVAGFICAADTELEPLLYGGTGVDSASHTLPETVPERYEVGSPNIIAIAGLNAAMKWLQHIGIKKIYESDQRSRIYLLDLLREFKNIRIVPSKMIENATGIISCLFDGYSSDSIGQVLSKRDIAVRTGLHCAPDAHRFLGTFPSGTVRFSVSYFNDKSDFEKLRNALIYIQENS
jgi:cysteine desulfurase family protein